VCTLARICVVVVVVVSECLELVEDPKMTSPSLRLTAHRSTLLEATVSTRGAVMAAPHIMTSLAG